MWLHPVVHNVYNGPEAPAAVARAWENNLTYSQVIAFFGTQVKVAAAAKTSQPAVSNWKSRGNIPAVAQFRLAAASQGQLKVSRNLL